jgi:hypothetical protein
MKLKRPRKTNVEDKKYLSRLKKENIEEHRKKEKCIRKEKDSRKIEKNRKRNQFSKL